MSEALNNLNDEYKQKKKEATSKEEKQQIKQDYKEMKTLIKGADKLLQKHDEELKKFDKVWDKLDKEYQKLGETPTFEEVKEELDDNQQQFEEQKKHSEEVIRQADETIKKIDEKLAELEKKESLEKNKKDYNNWKNEVLSRINSAEYLTIEEAKEKANNTIKNENDLTSVWEKDQKYYVVLSKDREVAFRNDYKEVVKYDELNENIKNNNGIKYKNTLERNSLSELYGYHSKNNINDKNSTLEYVNKINSMLSNYSFDSDENFVLLGRKKIIYDEICEILNGTKTVDNPLYFVLGSLEEFICNNNFVYMSDSEHWEKGWEDLRNRNDVYSQKNVICLEEKNIIEDIINRIKNYIEK